MFLLSWFLLQWKWIFDLSYSFRTTVCENVFQPRVRNAASHPNPSRITNFERQRIDSPLRMTLEISRTNVESWCSYDCKMPSHIQIRQDFKCQQIDSPVADVISSNRAGSKQASRLLQNQTQSAHSVTGMLTLVLIPSLNLVFSRSNFTEECTSRSYLCILFDMYLPLGTIWEREMKSGSINCLIHFFICFSSYIYRGRRSIKL